MQKGSGNRSALLVPVLMCEILSMFGSLNQYKHEGSFIQSISLYNLQDRDCCRACFMDTCFETMHEQRAEKEILVSRHHN